MLVLSRKHNESVVVGNSGCLERLLKVTVINIHNNRVVLGFEAREDVPVHRWEIWQRISADGRPGVVQSVNRAESPRRLEEGRHGDSRLPR
jgi:carbon storage regulator CsrA